MTAAPLIDHALFSEAKSLLGDKFSTILGYFLEDSADYVKTMVSACQNQQWAAMVLPAHSLKSSARQMGALHLSDLAKHIEAAAKESNGQALTPLIAQIGEILQKTQAAFGQI